MKLSICLLSALLLNIWNSHSLANSPVPLYEIDEESNIVSDRVLKRGRRRGLRGNERSLSPSKARVVRPRYRGTGCPENSASIAISPDKRTLTLLFDDFIVEAGSDVGIHDSRKFCRIVVPVEVDRGFQVAVVALDYRGYNFLTEGSKSRFRTVHFFRKPNQRAKDVPKVSYRQIFQGPIDEDYLLSTEEEAHRLWSPCGRDFNLHINTSMRSTTRSFTDEALSTVDSLDAVTNLAIKESNLDYHLLWRRCNSKPHPRPRPMPRPRGPRRHRN
jgi:hypothetical protein